MLNPDHFPFFVALAQELSLGAKDFNSTRSGGGGGSSSGNLNSPRASGGDGGGGGGGSGGSHVSSPLQAFWGGLSSPRSAAAAAVAGVAGIGDARWTGGGGGGGRGAGALEVGGGRVSGIDELNMGAQGTTQEGPPPPIGIGAGIRSDGGDGSAVLAGGRVSGGDGKTGSDFSSPSDAQRSRRLVSPSEPLLKKMGSGARTYVGLWRVLEKVRDLDAFPAVAEAAAVVVEVVVQKAEALAVVAPDVVEATVGAPADGMAAAAAAVVEAVEVEAGARMIGGHVTDSTSSGYSRR